MNCQKKLSLSIFTKLVFVVALLLPFQVCAQDEPEHDKYFQMSLEELLNVKVVTASAKSERIAAAPATIYSITEEQILIKGYSNLAEVLEDIPEIEVQKKSGPEMSNIFTIRGISGNEKIIILLDGIHVNANAPHAIGYNYSILNAKRIEVITGPASALYGADAFSGIINIITKTGNETNGINLNTCYGSYNTFENSFTTGIGNSDISFFLTGKYYYSNEPDFANIYKEDYSWYNNNYSQNGTMLLFGDTVTTSIRDYSTPTRAYYIHSKLNVKDFEFGYFRNFESHSSSVGFKPESAIYTKDAVINNAIESMYASHKFRSDNNKLLLQTTISSCSYEMLPESKYINQYVAYNEGYKYAFHKKLKAEEQLIYNINESYSTVLGICYEEKTSLPKTGDLPFKYDPCESPSMQNIHFIGTNIEDKDGNDLTLYQNFHFVSYNNFGIYLQIQSNINNKLGVTLGGRCDYNTRYGESVNPRVGLTYFPTNKLFFKLLYGKAFLAPSPFKAYQQVGSFFAVSDSSGITGLASNFWHLPNPNLKPQKVNSYEVSGIYFFDENLFLSLNAYYNDIYDLIVNQGFLGEKFYGIPVGYVQRLVNKGKAYSYGGTIKFDGKIKFGESIFSSYCLYSYSDGEIAGKPLTYSARNTIKAGLSAHFRRFNISLRSLYRSPSNHETSSKNSKVANDSYTVLNLFAKCDVDIWSDLKTSVFIKVDNLFNSKYYNVGFGGDFVRTPQDPVRIIVGINLHTN
jgi:iron complex outermembrane receptor protein